MSQAVDTQSQTLEQTLNKTDLGHVLYENRKVFLAALVSVLVLIMGYVAWKESRENKARTVSVKVFEFQNKTWAEAKAGKLPPAELAKAFSALDADVQSAPVMIPMALEMGKFLADKEAYAEADTILTKVEGSALHPVSAFFVGLQHAVILEKLGKTDQAITTLEKLLAVKDIVMPAKLSVELARLYIAKGEKGKAQMQLDHVLSNFPNDDQAKIAKLYKAQLAQ